MLQLCKNKNTNYRRWQENHYYLTKETYVGMGAYDCAEVCELVSTSFLEKNSEI